MKRRKLIAFLVSVVMVLTMFGTTALAEGNVASTGGTEYAKLADAIEAAADDGTVTVLQDVTLTEEITINKSLTFDGTGVVTTDGKLIIGDGVSLIAPNISGNIYAAAGATVTVNAEAVTLVARGDLTFTEANTVAGFSAGDSERTITISKGASLTFTGTGRMTVSYGNKFIIEGELADAKTTDKSTIMPSLKIPGGLSFNGNGGGAELNIKDAYVVLGGTTSKNSGATGEFNFNFDNSIVDFTNNLVMSAPTNMSLDPSFNFDIKDSVVKTASHWEIHVEKTNVAINNSKVDVGLSFTNFGTVDIKNNSEFNVLSHTVTEAARGTNTGTIIVDNSKIDVNCSSGEANALDGRSTGEIILQNGATADIDYITDSAISISDASLTGEKILGTSSVSVDPATTDTTKLAGLPAMDATVNSNVSVDAGTGEAVVYPVTIGTEKFSTLTEAIAMVDDNQTIVLHGDIALESTLHIDNNKTFVLDGNGYKITNAGTTTNAAFVVGNTGKTVDAADSDCTYTLRNIVFDGWTTDHVVRCQGVNVSIEGCTIQNSNQSSGLGLITLTFSNASITGCTFENNTCLEIIDANSWGDDSESDILISKCVFENNTCNSAAAVLQIYGDVTVDECAFTGNTVNAPVDGAVVFMAGYPDATKTITNNTFTNNTVTSQDSTGTVSGAIIAGAGTSVSGNNYTGNTANGVEVNDDIVAKIGEIYYGKLQDAVDAAESGDTIVLVKDITDYVVSPTADSTSNDNNALIHTDKDDAVILDLSGKTISVKGDDDAEFDTLAIRNNGTLTIVDTSEAKTGKISLAYNGTKEQGTSQIHSTILNFGTLTVNGGTIENTATTGSAKHAIYNYSWGGDANLTVDNGTIISDNGYAIYSPNYSEYGYDNAVTVKDGVIDGGIYYWAQSNNDGTFALTIKGGQISKENGSALTIADGTNGTKAPVVEVSGGTFAGADGEAAVKYITADGVEVTGFISGGSYSSDVSAFLAAGYDIERTASGYGVVTEGAETTADTIHVVFKDVTKADEKESKTYEIVLKSNDGNEIHELASVDLNFALSATANPTDAAMDITVLPAADFTLSRPATIAEGEENRYMFNYNGIGTAYEGSGNAITIGTITVDGYGTYSISVKNSTTNIVNATTTWDNLVDSYTTNGATDGLNTTGALIINTDVNTELVGKIEGGEIEVPTYNLHIDIDFPNTVKDNVAAYQNMTVSIVGGNINKVLKLGTDAEDAQELYKASIIKSADTTVASYDIDVKLPYNTTYTVTVEGAGYRTARHSVTLTGNKTLKFWNNVKDAAEAIEAGKTEVTKNFLAGDIVKDNKINVYDLSAVVSYFGTSVSVEDAPTYAKYDLNRDGVIDSLDVAYVLVSWNE